MITALVGAFLIVHGLLHLGVWTTPEQPDKPAPFDRGHSWALAAAHVSTAPARAAALALAWYTALVYVVAGCRGARGKRVVADGRFGGGRKRACPQGDLVRPVAQRRRAARRGRPRRAGIQLARLPVLNHCRPPRSCGTTDVLHQGRGIVRNVRLQSARRPRVADRPPFPVRRAAYVMRGRNVSTAIAVSGLIKEFGPTRALDRLDLTVGTG